MALVFKKTLNTRCRADVAVVGGGIAGVAAAVAAADRGAEVVLIERFAVTGGNATSGGVAAFCGETAGQGRVFDEIVSELERCRAIVPYRPYPEMEARCFDHEILAFILQEMLLRHKVRLLLHTRVADCVMEGSELRGCLIAGPAGLEAVEAGMFIDCSGEAILVHCAGLAAMKGGEDSPALLPMALMAFVRHTRKGDRFPVIPEDVLAAFQSDGELPAMSIWPNGPRANAIKIKLPGCDPTDPESFTAAEICARRTLMRVLDDQIRVKGKKWMFDHCSPLVGIREGRRAVGDYVLRKADLRAGRRFDDAVALGRFYLDSPSQSSRHGWMFDEKERKVPPYQIPFRSLVVKGARNLLVAGRCFSADQAALSSARVMTTCAMMGQAAGIGAALAVVRGGNVRAVDFGEVRSEVVRNGAVLDCGEQ